MVWIGVVIIAVIIAPIAVICLIYFWLAKINLFWTFVPEGYAKIIGKGDAFFKAILSFQGYTFDERWNVVPEDKWVRNGEVLDVVEVIKEEPITHEDRVKHRTRGRVKVRTDRGETEEIEAAKYKEPRHLFGGLRFYGIYPFVQVLFYPFRWTHLHEDGSVVTHEETLDAILLKTDLYVVEIPLSEHQAAEDIDGLPLSIAWVMPMRIVNVYEAIFVYRRWLVIITGVVKALLRTFVARYRYKEDLLDMVAGEGIEERQKEKGIAIVTKPGRDLREEFWEQLREALIKEAREQGAEITTTNQYIRVFGVEIQRRGCEPLSIEPGGDYRRLTTLRYEAEKEKERRIIEAQGKREAIREKTSRTLVGMLCDILGESEEAVERWLKKKMDEDPEIEKLVLGEGLGWIKKDMADQYYFVEGESKGPQESILLALTKKFLQEKK